MKRLFEQSDADVIRSDWEAVGGDLSRTMIDASAKMGLRIDPRVIESARRAKVNEAQFSLARKPKSTFKKLGDGVLRLLG